MRQGYPKAVSYASPSVIYLISSCRLPLLFFYRYHFLLLLLLLAGACPTQAQQFLLTGRITEAATGKPVPFASVFVPGTTAGATADENGRYSLSTAPADTRGGLGYGLCGAQEAYPAQVTTPNH